MRSELNPFFLSKEVGRFIPCHVELLLRVMTFCVNAEYNE